MALAIYRKKDSIIKQAGISLSPDGTEDTKLYVRGLPDITVGPWKMEDFSGTLDSDEEVCRRCPCGHPYLSTRSMLD